MGPNFSLVLSIKSIKNKRNLGPKIVQKSININQKIDQKSVLDKVPGPLGGDLGSPGGGWSSLCGPRRPRTKKDRNKGRGYRKLCASWGPPGAVLGHFAFQKGFQMS